MAGPMRLRWTGIALLVVFTLPALAFVVQGVWLVGHRYTWENGEGIVLVDAIAMYSGHWPYRDLRGYPFLVGNYPPVYTGLCAAAMAIAGPTSYGPGRLISLLAMAAIAVAIAVVVAQETRSRALAAAGGMAIFSVGCITRVGPVCRVDALAAALSLWGVVLVHRQLGARRWVAPVILFVLAGYTKQSAVAGAAASIVYLAFADRPKALVSVGLLAGIGFAILGVLQVATGGRFLTHLLTYTWTGFDWLLVWAYLRGGLRQGLLLFVLSAAALAATTVRRAAIGKPACRGRGLILLYLALNALGLVQLGKVGVSYLYYIEFAAAACLTLPLLMADLVVLWDRLPRRQALVLSAMVLAAVAHVAANRGDIADGFRRPQGVLQARLTGVFVRADGPILAEEVGALITAGKPVLVNPFILTQVGASTRFVFADRDGRRTRVEVAKRSVPALKRAHDRVLEDIRQERFHTIQTGALLDVRRYGPVPPRGMGLARTITDERFSPAWQKAIAEHYCFQGLVGLQAVYVPRSAGVN